MILPAEPTALILGFFITFTAALLQSTVGFGFGIVCVPLLSLIDPSVVPVPQILLGIPLTFSTAWREREAIEVKPVAWLLAGRVPGALSALWILAWANQRLMDVIIGGLVLLAAFVVVSGARIPMNPFTQFTAGWASGISNMVASIGGPPVALLYGQSRGPVIRANIAAVLGIGILITLVTRLFAGLVTVNDVQVALFWLPALMLGFYCSQFLTARVEGRILRGSIVVIACSAGLALVLRGLSA